MKYRIKEQKKTLVTGITKRLNHDFNNHVTLLLYHGKFSCQTLNFNKIDKFYRKRWILL